MHPKEKLRSIKHFTAYHLAIDLCAGKSLSEALIFASTNPQYDDRLFHTFKTIFVHNMFSPGLSLEFSCIELLIQ